MAVASLALIEETTRRYDSTVYLPLVDTTLCGRAPCTPEQYSSTRSTLLLAKLALGTFATGGPHAIGLGITGFQILASGSRDFHHDKYFHCPRRCLIELDPSRMTGSCLSVANAYLLRCMQPTADTF